jgi:hypothetical protein
VSNRVRDSLAPDICERTRTAENRNGLLSDSRRHNDAVRKTALNSSGVFEEGIVVILVNGVLRKSSAIDISLEEDGLNMKLLLNRAFFCTIYKFDNKHTFKN